MRHLSAFIFVVLLVVLPSCKYFKGGLFGKKADNTAVWKEKQESIRIADSIKGVQDRLAAIENAKIDSARNAENERTALESKFKFNIIVGSFKTPEYARSYAEVYKEKGYEVRIIKMDGSTFELVSAEVHDSFRKAVSRLNEFQADIEPEAWMYIKK